MMFLDRKYHVLQVITEKPSVLYFQPWELLTEPKSLKPSWFLSVKTLYHHLDNQLIIMGIERSILFTTQYFFPPYNVPREKM